MNREQLIKELQALIDDRDECIRVADFILRHTEELRKENEELNKQVGAALGTADHYCKENDRLNALVSEVEKIIQEHKQFNCDHVVQLDEATAKIAEFKEWRMKPSPR